MDKKPLKISLFKQVVFSLTLIVLSLALLEGFCRVFFDKPSKYNFLLESEHPLSIRPFFVPLLGQRVVLDKNKDFFDFNGEKLSRKRTDPREVRVFMVGGSAALGLGSTSPEKTYYKEFERLLNSNQPQNGEHHYKVITTAEAGRMSAGELVYLNMGLLEFNPDMVIVYDGYNDLYVLYGDGEPGHAPGLDNNNKILNASPLAVALRRIYSRSRLLRFIGNKFFKKALIEANLKKLRTDERLQANIIRHYKRNLENMVLLLKAYHVKTVLAFQPNLFDKKTKTKIEKAFINHEFGESFAKTCRVVFPKMERALEEVAIKQGIIFSDFRNVFDSHKEQVYIDWVHNNDFGQKFLGSVFFDKFSSYIYNKTPQPETNP